MELKTFISNKMYPFVRCIVRLKGVWYDDRSYSGEWINFFMTPIRSTKKGTKDMLDEEDCNRTITKCKILNYSNVIIKSTEMRKERVVDLFNYFIELLSCDLPSLSVLFNSTSVQIKIN